MNGPDTNPTGKTPRDERAQRKTKTPEQLPEGFSHASLNTPEDLKEQLARLRFYEAHPHLATSKRAKELHIIVVNGKVVLA